MRQSPKTRIGDFLRAVRNQRNETIAELAARIGVNSNTLAAYERGERLAPIGFVAEFVRRIECDGLHALNCILADVRFPVTHATDAEIEQYEAAFRLQSAMVDARVVQIPLGS